MLYREGAHDWRLPLWRLGKFGREVAWTTEHAKHAALDLIKDLLEDSFHLTTSFTSWISPGSCTAVAGVSSCWGIFGDDPDGVVTERELRALNREVLVKNLSSVNFISYLVGFGCSSPGFIALLY